MSLIRTILTAPLSWLYGLAIGTRHLLYDLHLLRTKEVDIPTICVGNLSVGGTGKTPHIEWLIRKLSPQYKVAVLSRGYRRRSRGFVLASEQSTARDLGDECAQLHRKFPHIPIAVCKNRVEGIRQLRKHCPEVEVILLDDAYQYRHLKCGYYILLTTADLLYPDDRLLPLGRLRDFAWQSSKANAVVVSKCPDRMTAIDRRVISNRLRLPAYQSLYFSHTVYEPLPSLSQPVGLITGIARPEYIEDYLKQQYNDLTTISFPDHHRFTKVDLAMLEKLSQKVAILFTTEKDYARLAAENLSDSLREKLYPVPIQVSLSDEEHLLQQIYRYLQHA